MSTEPLPTPTLIESTVASSVSSSTGPPATTLSHYDSKYYVLEKAEPQYYGDITSDARYSKNKKLGLFLVDPDLHTSVTDQVDRLVMPVVEKAVAKTANPTLTPASSNLTSAEVCWNAVSEIRDAILAIANTGDMVHITVQEERPAVCRIVHIPLMTGVDS